jgi:HlyD family secretion protein
VKNKDSKDPAGKYQRTAVETGLSDGVSIEIKKGLTLKDKLRGPEIITDDED